jgi:hypothetical protein
VIRVDGKMIVSEMLVLSRESGSGSRRKDQGPGQPDCTEW